MRPEVLAVGRERSGGCCGCRDSGDRPPCGSFVEVLVRYSESDQAIQAQTVATARWVARAETRGLRIGIWVLILGSLALPKSAGSALGLGNLLVILGQLVWSSRIAARARRELAQTDPARLHTVFEQLRILPGPRRTFEALHTALAGVGVAVNGPPAPPAVAGPLGGDESLSCYERGSHRPGCPHQTGAQP